MSDSEREEGTSTDASSATIVEEFTVTSKVWMREGSYRVGGNGSVRVEREGEGRDARGGDRVEGERGLSRERSRDCEIGEREVYNEKRLTWDEDRRREVESDSELRGR